MFYRSSTQSEKQLNNSSKKTVVIFGAGHVSAPLIEYLHRDSNILIIIASEQEEQCLKLVRKYPRIESYYLNASENVSGLQDLVSKSDLAVSILPIHLHHVVAEACIKAKTHMVTASYVSENMKQLHQRALDADVTILNEVGLDPGIDHLLALDCIDDVKQKGGTVTSFVSFCGGLPAPEFSDNPLGYKFSWSPRGVLLNTFSSAKYLSNGQIVEISEGGELMVSAIPLNFLPGFNLEGFPNRDSTAYIELYGIPDVKTILRGTIRYSGFAQAVRTLQLLGLLDLQPHPALENQQPRITWKTFMRNLLQTGESNCLKQSLIKLTGSDNCYELLDKLQLLTDKPIPMHKNPCDCLIHHLSEILTFGAGERDLVILRHDVGITWPDKKREIIGINLIVYGDTNGHSAMAKTVGIPTAIAAKMILDGEIREKGVIRPFSPEIYKQILRKLKIEGIYSTEKSKYF